MLFIPATLAIDVKTIKKEKKELIKLIKKKYSCKKVIPVVSDDGSYYYFQVVNKTKDKGVVDNNGNLIVPMEYREITYMPPVEEGYSKVECNSSRKKVKIIEGKYAQVYHKKTDASFFASSKRKDTLSVDRNGDFYNLNGELITSTNCNGIMVLPGYAILLHDLNHKKMYGNTFGAIDYGIYRDIPNPEIFSFFRSDGTPIAEDISFLRFFREKDAVKYKKSIDGIARFGIYNTIDPQESVPCNYCEIKTIDGILHVKQNALDEFVPYSAELGALGIIYRDEGEKLFNQEKWDDVINYYANNGIDAPWGSYISAEALYKKTAELSEGIIRTIMQYNYTPSKIFNNLDDPKNLEVAYECCKTAYMLNYKYINLNEDTTYIKQANILHEKLLTACVEFPKYQETYAKIIKINQYRIEQRQQMVLAILSATTNALSQAASNSQSSYNKSGTVYKSNNTTNVKQNNATSTNQNTETKQDNSGRKGFLRVQIIEYEKKLKDAEESLEKSIEHYAKDKLSGNGDAWRTKQVVDAKRKTVDEYKKILQGYKDELNSLQ